MFLDVCRLIKLFCVWTYHKVGGSGKNGIRKRLVKINCEDYDLSLFPDS